MTPITRQDILAHQAVVPWSTQHQVEQDLLLCRAMVALFDDTFLSAQIAMRGGTLLHKVHLAPPARYSEDIDLVVVGTRPEEHVRRAVRRVLAEVLGTPKASVWDTIKLALRNTVKPSRVLRMTYSMPSIIEPSRMLDIVVEANVTEKKPGRSSRPETKPNASPCSISKSPRPIWPARITSSPAAPGRTPLMRWLPPSRAATSTAGKPLPRTRRWLPCSPAS